MKYNEKRDPIRLFVELFGGKWRLLILDELFSQTQRFKDLQNNVEGITPRMLTKELKVLVANNIVEKEVYKEMPPRVEYSLTDFGIKLLPLIENIKNFGNDLIDQSIYARKPFDDIDLSITESETSSFESVKFVQPKDFELTESINSKIINNESTIKGTKVEEKKSVWRNYQKADIDYNFIEETISKNNLSDSNEDVQIEKNIDLSSSNETNELEDSVILEPVKIKKMPSKKEIAKSDVNTGVQLSLF